MSKNSNTPELNTTVEQTLIKEIPKELKNDGLNRNVENCCIEKSVVPALVPTESPWKHVGSTITDVSVNIQDVQDKLGLLLQKQNEKKNGDSVSHQLMKKTMPKESHVPFDAKIIISNTNGLNNLQSVHIEGVGFDGKVENENEKTKQRKKRKQRNKKKEGIVSSNSIVNEKPKEKETRGEKEEEHSSVIQKIEKNGHTNKSKRSSRKTQLVKQEDNKINEKVKSDNKDIKTTTKKEKKQHKRKQHKKKNKNENENTRSSDVDKVEVENGKTVKETNLDTQFPKFLVENVAKQLQYYFSDENLIKDEYLKSLFSSVSGFVPLSTIVGFYRLSNMSNGGDPTIILGAIYSLLSLVTNEEINFKIATIESPLLQDNILSKYLIRSNKWDLYLTSDSKPIEYNNINLIDHRDLAEYKGHLEHY